MKNQEQIYDWIVIGDGISSLSFIFFLLNKFPNLKIMQIHSPVYAPATEVGTGLLVPFGIKKNISELGDLLVEGLEFTSEFLYSNFFNCLTELKVAHFASSDDQNFLNRYQDVVKLEKVYKSVEEGYLLHWPILKKAFLTHQNKRVDRQIDTVLNVGLDENVSIKGQLKIYQSHRIFYGLGHGRDSLPSKETRGKIIAGDGLYWPNLRIFNDNRLMTYKGFNCLQTPQKLVFGASTEDRARMQAISWEVLESRYDEFKKVFNGVNFPEFFEGIPFSGFRHKLSKRRPYWGFDGVSAEISGLYKNGYILAPYLAHKLVENLNNS